MTTRPDMMTAIAIDGKGGPEVLKPITLPVPVPGAGQVLIELIGIDVKGAADIVSRCLGRLLPGQHRNQVLCVAIVRGQAQTALVQGYRLFDLALQSQHIGHVVHALQ